MTNSLLHMFYMHYLFVFVRACLFVILLLYLPALQFRADGSSGDRSALNALVSHLSSVALCLLVIAVSLLMCFISKFKSQRCTMWTLPFPTLQKC